MSSHWKNCSVCKSPIPYNTPYYVCSVSGCKSQRKGFVFCRVQCWDEHRADLNHRNAWAEELTSPKDASASDRVPKRTVISVPTSGRPSSSGSSFGHAPIGKPIQTETLVVVSKVKQLIKDLADCNTSQCAIDALTEKVVGECRKAITAARADGRKTVMGRDIE